MTVHTEIGSPLNQLGNAYRLFIDTGELVPCATECRNSLSNNAWLDLYVNIAFIGQKPLIFYNGFRENMTLLLTRAF